MAFTVNNATVAQKFYTWADWTGKYGDPILKKGGNRVLYIGRIR